MTAIDAFPVTTHPTETAPVPTTGRVPARTSLPACPQPSRRGSQAPPGRTGRLALARAQVAARYGVSRRRADTAAPQVAETVAAAADLPRSVLDVQLSHRSVRRFLPRPLASSVLPTLVAAAQSAPTSSNLQLWSVVAITDPARLARVARLCGEQEHVRDAPLLLVWVADVARVRALAARRGRAVPATGYLETTVASFLDATLAAQNAVVAAESLGLGTVYLGSVRDAPEALAAELRLPRGAAPVVGLVVGHPDPSCPGRVKPRLPQAAVLHHETYDVERQLRPVAAYERRMVDYYRGEGLEGGWVARALARLRGNGSLRGREHLRSALTALGLPSW
ncbi:NADPH-dependent oxidoreductase [Promicromonospora citrea]|uniref:NADPH-dependent oxidoreductase n=2 Tax=Promicromonospora citrea TaxID=43677 RepID=A0A8H9GMS3_9MICO|nr:NADPH-dependent oxidoreductase [Promicromonospora citrea]GGM39555.1 NADPH-dependent oxidoreductase [Promicromonospora citrea]